jgi:hypothetical protein
MSCICGGQLVDGPFGPRLSESEEDRMQQMVPALEAFLRGAGPSPEATMLFWATLRAELVTKLALAYLVESGQVHVTGHDETGTPLLGLREPGP